MATRTSDLQSLLAGLERRTAAEPDRVRRTLVAAEALLASGDSPEPDLWPSFLDRTRRPDFLSALPDDAARRRWAEVCFAAIDRAGYGLEEMLAQRTAAHPDTPLFQVAGKDGLESWSYAQVRRRIDAVAAVLLDLGTEEDRAPRVALFTENCLAGACCDLACLAHGIVVAPLNTGFDGDTLVWIFDSLGIGVAVTDDWMRHRLLCDVRERTARPFRILLLSPAGEGEVSGDDARLDELVARRGAEDVEASLRRRPPRGLHDVATVMFTSGSTGQPKGVVFSLYHLITKRFARAAALPAVGESEVLLCYLPLFHTFGRFLEMMGAIFWGGTYVFAGNPSADTLLSLLPEVCPTGLISIPLRWQQIRERILSRGEAGGPEEIVRRLRDVVGGRLRWGLSAAGHLDSRVFRFFQRHGVDLLSGFGMTEATGGITMTPPGSYRDESVGVPLPGVQVRFDERGELSIAGPYVARYFEPGEDVDAPFSAPSGSGAPTAWLPTGDLFQEVGDGHLRIVDRVKDIYKNNRGQTIAPRRVEQRFSEVDGIVRTFLAGDGRAYNTLLIVPDRANPVLEALPDAESEREYFAQIVTAANADLASFERVVNFTVLDRDFDAERGELTPKGSYRRKVIERNFRGTIADLYRGDRVELAWGAYRILVPHWFFRDLGILETELRVEEDALVDTARGVRLPLCPGPEEGWLQVGDLAYHLEGDTVDLGLFARHPFLWCGNPALGAFCPCRPGWDALRRGVGEQVLLPEGVRPTSRVLAPALGDRQLAALDALFCTAQFEVGARALAALEELAHHLQEAEERVGRLIRRRLEALARHSDQAVRCRAFHVLVQDEPVPDYTRYLPAFIQSGRTFLSEQSIVAIASGRLEARRLQAFRQRLHGYRTQLSWPADPATSRVFDDLFRLLCDFARFHPEYYALVREELAVWVLFDADPGLALRAENHLLRLAEWFEDGLRARSPDLDPADWEGKLVFQDTLSPRHTERLRKVLVGTPFLAESILLIFEGETFAVADAAPGGIWVSRILSAAKYARFRVSVNTTLGKHFDLQIILREDQDEDWVMETIFWMIAIHGHPHGTPVLGRFGCCRPELGAISQSYTSDLTVWEKIREFGSVYDEGRATPTRDTLRKLFVRAMTLFFEAWRNSGERIVPGAVSPANVSVPESDFRLGARIQSMAGWCRYDGPVSLVGPLVQNFFLQTSSHYPWCRRLLDRAWIFDACAEALGRERAARFLHELRADLRERPLAGGADDLEEDIARASARLAERYHVPLAVEGACNRFREWGRANARATGRARRQLLEELSRLYRLDRHPRLARYHLFRNTYFAEAAPPVREAFDRLLARMFEHPDRVPSQMVELSDLQALLEHDEDRITLHRLVFPRTAVRQRAEVRTVGSRDKEHVIVTTHIEDQRGASYTVREPLEASEVGRVYRLFLLAGFPKTISAEDRFFVVVGDEEEIVGGICYKHLPDEMVHLDGIVVTRSLLDRGLTSALLEDFCARMTEQGKHAVRTHFFLQRFYQRRGFRLDDRWGGLVRFLEE